MFILMYVGCLVLVPLWACQVFSQLCPPLSLCCHPLPGLPLLASFSSPFYPSLALSLLLLPEELRLTEAFPGKGSEYFSYGGKTSLHQEQDGGAKGIQGIWVQSQIGRETWDKPLPLGAQIALSVKQRSFQFVKTQEYCLESRNEAGGWRHKSSLKIKYCN